MNNLHKLIKSIFRYVIIFIILIGLILTFKILLSFNETDYAVEIAEYEDSWDIVNCERDSMYDGWSVEYVIREGDINSLEVSPISKANIINAPKLKKDMVYTNCLVYKPVKILGFKFSYPVRMDYAVNVGEPNVVSLGNTTLVDYYNKDSIFRNMWDIAMNTGVNIFHDLELSTDFESKLKLFAGLYYFYFVVLGILAACIISPLYKAIKEYLILTRMDDIEKEKYYISKNKNHRDKEWE